MHVLSSSNVYEDLKFDIFSVADRQVVERQERLFRPDVYAQIEAHDPLLGY